MAGSHDAPRRIASRATRIGGRGLRVGAALLLVAFCLRDDVQPDLYFHLAAGRDMVRSGGLPTRSQWLAQDDQPGGGFPFVDHEWAFQLAAWPLFRAGGPPALHLVKTLLAAVCLGGLLVATRRQGAARWLVAAPLILAIGPRLVLRPEVAAYAGLGVALGGMAWTRWRPSSRVSAGLGLLQVVWTNVHGLALAVPLAVGATLAACLLHVEARRRGWRLAGWLGEPGCPRRLAVTLLCVGVGQLCHAYGPRGALYVAEQAILAFTRDAVGTIPITEFIPPLDPRVRGQPLVALVLVWAALAPALVLVGLRGKRLRLEELAQAAVLVPLAWPYVRNLPLAAIGLFPLTCAALAAALGAAARRAPQARTAAPLAGALALLLLARATLADRFHDNADHDARAGVSLGDFLRYDEAARALDAGAGPGSSVGPLFNTFGSGHSLIWFRDGRPPRPFICGNLDLYPRSHLDLYHALVEGRVDWRSELERLGLRCLLLDHRVEVPAFFDALLADPAWVVWHADTQAVLVARAGDAPPLDRAALARSFLARSYEDERPDGFGPTRLLRALWLLPERQLRPLERMQSALLLERLGRPEEALALARKARDLAPTFAPVVLAAAELERRHGDPVAARRLYDLAAELVPESAGPLVGLGHLELASGAPAAAAAAFRRAHARAPAASEPVHGLLAALEVAGDPVELRRALAELRPGLRPGLARYYEGAAARLDGDLPAARAALEDALALEPRLAPALDRLARVRLEARDLEGAEELLARLVGVTPASASAWRDLGTVRFDRGRGPEALDAWRRAAEVDRREDLALVYAAQLHLGQGRPLVARPLVEEALRRNPSRPEAQALLRRLGKAP